MLLWLEHLALLSHANAFVPGRTGARLSAAARLQRDCRLGLRGGEGGRGAMAAGPSFEGRDKTVLLVRHGVTEMVSSMGRGSLLQRRLTGMKTSPEFRPRSGGLPLQLKQCWRGLCTSPNSINTR